MVHTKEQQTCFLPPSCLFFPTAVFWVIAGTTTELILSAEAVRSVRLVDLLNERDEWYHQEEYYYDNQDNTHSDPTRTHATAADDKLLSHSLNNYDDVQVGYIQQSLDHFRLEDDREFQQRYFYTDRYVNHQAERQYAFLCVGGEGPALDKSVLVDSVHCTGDMIEAARRLFQKGNFSIHLYALEHRYYGKSYPTFDNDKLSNSSSSSSSPVTNQHLVYLSSRQAQADLAHFVFTQSSFFLPKQHIPWITFGGSYPGMMAAYARLRFPHYIAAAVSSSAPIGVTLDFPDYNNHVAKVLNDTQVGGSPACLQIFTEGHATLAELVQNPQNHARLASQFGLCNATQLSSDPRNVQLWLGDGVIAVGAQSNDPSCQEPLCNVGKKCAALLQSRLRGDSPVQALAKLQRQSQGNGECTHLSWEETVQALSNVSQQLLAGGWRSWLWQTCVRMVVCCCCCTSIRARGACVCRCLLP